MDNHKIAKELVMIAKDLIGDDFEFSLPREKVPSGFRRGEFVVMRKKDWLQIREALVDVGAGQALRGINVLPLKMGAKNE